MLVTRRVPSLLITPDAKRMQRKNAGGKKIQLWLVNDVIADGIGEGAEQRIGPIFRHEQTEGLSKN